MRDICFIDKSFDSTENSNLHLSVQISLDGLFFTILDDLKGKYVVLNGYHFFLKRPRLLLKRVKEIIEKEELLRNEYKSVDILYSTNVFTMIPAVFHSVEDDNKILHFNHPQEKGFLTKGNFFPRAEVWGVFSIPENLNIFLENAFPKATIRHTLFPLIEKGIQDNFNDPAGEQVHVNFFRECFEIAVIKGAKLLQCNIFNYKTERDILFYVLYVFDQLKLSAVSTELFIYGHLPQVSPVYHLLKKYIRKTSFAKPDNTFQYSYTFSQIPEHYYSTIFNLYKCV